MRHFVILLSIFLAGSAWGQNTNTPIDTTQVQKLDEVLVESIRVKADSPITHSNLTREELQQRNLGQDLPTQLNYLPNVVTTSDAGAGIGYTGLRVRGTGNQGINVTINGIPYNDAESLTTFFVNLQDFTSSIESVQLQRGVGSSTNGPGAFGASLTILTDAISNQPYAQLSNSLGSFNTRRHTLKFSTGLLSDHIEVSGRLSQIKSDGYIDRATSDLKGYYLQAAYTDENRLLKAITFGGSEVTYQSWFGFEAGATAAVGQNPNVEENRTFNIAGIQLDSEGNFEGYYDNQVDDYQQDHYQLHWNERYSNQWSSTVSLNYTYGRGFFEEYVDSYLYSNIYFDPSATFAFFGLDPVSVDGENITETDLIRRRWLDNDFYVVNATVNYQEGMVDAVGGILGSTYQGDHFGDIVWSEFPLGFENRERYYQGDATKNEVSAFAKATLRLSSKWSVYGDLQGRFIDYTTNGINSDLDTFIVDESYTFFNPKAGVSFRLNPNQQYYFSFARANREPNRTDFENGNPVPEQLNDFELGWRFKKGKTILNVNGYYMDYTNQLVLTGALDDVGAPIRANSGSSYRLGIEMDAQIKVSDQLSVMPNLALSSNKNRDFFFSRDGVLTNLGNTSISYSPDLVLGNILEYMPLQNTRIQFLSKYVGSQYMGNIDSENSKLDAFFVNDLNISYEIENFSIFKSILVQGLINNIFDNQYISNGYFFTFNDDFSVPNEITTVEGVGYYPQAGINFLIGATLTF